MKYGKRSPWKKIISSPLTLFILLITFIVLTKAALSIHEKALLSETKLEIAKTELADLKAHQQNLANKISYLSTDQGVEAELRTKYRAVKDGESVAVILDDQTANVNNTVTSTVNAANKDNASTTTAKVGWFGRMLRMIGL
jgi:cell division protein FtsB